jgi:hypothetical protein
LPLRTATNTSSSRPMPSKPRRSSRGSSRRSQARARQLRQETRPRESEALGADPSHGSPSAAPAQAEAPSYFPTDATADLQGPVAVPTPSFLRRLNAPSGGASLVCRRCWPGSARCCARPRAAGGCLRIETSSRPLAALRGALCLGVRRAGLQRQPRRVPSTRSASKAAAWFGSRNRALPAGRRAAQPGRPRRRTPGDRSGGQRRPG